MGNRDVTGQKILTGATAEQVAAKIQLLLRPVEAICRGDKPTEYPKELILLLSRMWNDGFLTESPASYLYLPGEDASDPALARYKGKTWVHPISLELTQRRQVLDSAASNDGVFNYKVLGLDPYFRNLSRTGNFDASDPLEQCEDAGALILPRGDMHSLRQALHILYAKLTNDGRAKDTALIIQNTHNGFWNPLLDAMGVNANDPLLAAYGVHITQYPGGNETVDEGKSSTLQVLKGLPHMYIPASRDRMDASIMPGDTIYVASGSPHKSKEIGAAFATLRARVNVYSLNSVIDVKPREADETSCSLEGNNMEKLQAVVDRIRVEGYDKVAAALCTNGKRPENVWLMFDDRGLEFLDYRIMDAHAFDPLRPLLNPYLLKPGPGAELAGIIKTFSRTRLFEDMLAGAVTEIEGKENAKPADLTVSDTACHITVRLDWLKDQNLRYIATMAKVQSTARTHPSPTIDARGRPIQAFQTDHYLVPSAFDGHLPPKQRRTKAEIDGYIETHSEVVGSIRALSDMTGVSEHSKNLSNFNLEFNAAASGKQNYRIASLHTLFADIYGHGNRRMHRIVTGPFKMMSGNGSRFSMAEFRNSGPMLRDTSRTSDRHRRKAESVLNRMRALYKEADGFLLTEDSHKLYNFSGIKWLKTLLYYSLVVGKQVDDRAIKAKFFGHLTGNTSWADQENIFHHLAQTPLLNNRQDDIMGVYATGTALRRGLKKFNTSYIRPKITEKGVVEKDDGVEMPADLYRVTVYCSASLGKETDACKNAHTFAYNLAQNGFALINGGGKEGLMVATSEGVHHARREWRRDRRDEMPRNHVTSYQCHDTFEREGGWHKDNDDARIFEVIEQRMAHLMNTDAEILMAGGAGSIQEIAASILMRQWGIMPVINRPLVIVNEQIDGIRVFDALIKMMSNEEMIRLNVHVVDNQAQAMDILMKSRVGMQKMLKPGEIYIPANAPWAAPHKAQDKKPAMRLA